VIQTQVLSSHQTSVVVVLAAPPQEELRAHPGAIVAARRQVVGERQVVTVVEHPLGTSPAVAVAVVLLHGELLVVRLPMAEGCHHELLLGKLEALLPTVVKRHMAERQATEVVPRMAAEPAMVAAPRTVAA